jgi:competence protein ComEC
LNKVTACIFLGAVIFSLTRSYDFDFLEDRVEGLEGFVASEVSKSKKLQSFVFEVAPARRPSTSTRRPSESWDPGHKILIKTEKYFSYSYGDKISISGNLKTPENFENENGIIFNYQKYLLKDGIAHTVFYPKIEILEKESRKDFKFYIFNFKNYFTSQSKRIFTSETSALVLGVLLGVKDSIDPDLEDNFRRTGLIHILVLSGFNLTIIAYFVFKLLGSLHRNIRFTVSLVFIFLFVILVGAGATIVRAGIMISIFIFSKLFRRNSNPFNALVLAGSFMIFFNPMILLHDPSFQLSFVATLGLVSFFSILEKPLFFIPKWLSLREIVVSNIAVQITIIPLLIFLMGEFSIISLIPNILILPLIPIFMLISFISIILSLISQPLSLIPIFVTEKLSDFMVWIVNSFGNLSFSILKVGAISPQLLISILFFYLFIILILDLRQKFITKRRYSYLRS